MAASDDLSGRHSEQRRASFAQILRGMRRGSTLTPTRALPRPTFGLAPVADGAKLVAVGARHDGGGWSVQLLQRGEAVATLAPHEARELAAELTEMADVIEGRRW